MTRGARCALFGVGMTVFALIGPWTWPAWPAVTLLDFVLARYTPSVVPTVIQAFGTIVLLAVNTAFWGGAGWVVLKVRDTLRKKSG